MITTRRLSRILAEKEEITLNRKDNYQRTQLIITKFDKEDVIATSGTEPIVPDEKPKPQEWGKNGLQLFPGNWY